MINLGDFFGDKFEEVKKIGSINEQKEQFGDTTFATMGASYLAEGLAKKYPTLLDAFCKKRQITEADALNRIMVENDPVFIAKILPDLIRDIAVDQKSERIYDALIKELNIPEQYRKEAEQALLKSAPKKLDKMFS